jgi:hypothetical protein
MGDISNGRGGPTQEVGKMMIDYLIPLHKPSTCHVGDIVYIKKSVGSRGYTFFLRPLEKSRYKPQCFFTLKQSLEILIVSER